MNEARRYLLGAVAEAERDAIEERYFRDESVLDEVSAEEDALIDEYLTDRLDAADRSRFEAHYLASPVHRRRLMLVKSLSTRIPRRRSYGWLAAAALLVLATGAGWWSLSQRGGTPSGAVTEMNAPAPTREPAPPAPTRQPRVFAFTVPAVRVRSAVDGSPLVVPPGTDIVALRLEGERPGSQPIRVELRTISGTVAWQGDAAASADANAVVVEVVADRLRPDDYFVVVLERGAGGEQERGRYFLPVRAP